MSTKLTKTQTHTDKHTHVELSGSHQLYRVLGCGPANGRKKSDQTTIAVPRRLTAAVDTQLRASESGRNFPEQQCVYTKCFFPPARQKEGWRKRREAPGEPRQVE
ncbi:uncharacterized protein LOC120418284 [Culex pipiens pallens]|uniref:uncharacterized protein LOC120418284 n=1 Tax=Culex pipiens pallens TaxID=42434 RepID=UPI0019541B10|nr:uncharacterized protein LOC120418284 [Culex pipiens pallens]